MTNDFDFSEFDPSRRTAWLELPIHGANDVDGSPMTPALEVLHAGQDNRAYARAVDAANKRARRPKSGDGVGLLELGLKIDRETFPRYIVKGWRGIAYTPGGPEVPFSQEEAIKLFDKLPPWVLRRVSRFVTDPKNFVGVDIPDEEDVEDQAGN